jgi:hypothetical protein
MDWHGFFSATILGTETRKTTLADLGECRYILGASGDAPVAQLDRAFDYESKGRPFESGRAHQQNQ